MKIAAWIIRLLYWLCSCVPQRNEIVFLSRQSPKPFDFVLLEPELRKRFPDYELCWECVSQIGKMDPLLMVRQIWHAARARICFVDGYVPAVSVPKYHRALVIQVWHAPGAIKKFGYQSLDTPAGRTSRQAETLRMHRGYDYIVAGLPGAVEVFAEAFDAPAERIVPLGLPRGDYLMSPAYAARREARASSIRARLGLAADHVSGAGPAGMPAPVVLYTPTFRKGCSDPDWMSRAVSELARELAPTGAQLVVAGHPLDAADAGHDGDLGVAYLSGASTIDALAIADYVVTDYSTVVFEAGFAGKPVLFYTPDIDEYRVSPGLNIDPLVELPTLAFRDAAGIAAVVSGHQPYDGEAFRTFMLEQMNDMGAGAIGRIVAFAAEHLEMGE